MKKKTTAPARSNLSVLGQLLNFIPPHLVPPLAREYGADRKSRTFTPWSRKRGSDGCLGLAEFGDWYVLEEMQAQDAHLVLGAVMTAVFLVHSDGLFFGGAP